MRQEQQQPSAKYKPSNAVFRCKPLQYSSQSSLTVPPKEITLWGITGSLKTKNCTCLLALLSSHGARCSGMVGLMEKRSPVGVACSLPVGPSS